MFENRDGNAPVCLQDGGLSEETDRLEDRQQDGQRDRQAVSPESKVKRQTGRQTGQSQLIGL